MIVHEAIRRLRTEGGYQDLEETINLDGPDTPLYVNGETISLREMIRNIIENALTHAPGPVNIDLRQRNDLIEFAVHDRGPGLSPEMKDRAFDRFVRADQNKPGSGLGLSIAKMVAEALGGQIELLERQGGGTSVVVTLPAAKPQRQSA